MLKILLAAILLFSNEITTVESSKHLFAGKTIILTETSATTGLGNHYKVLDYEEVGFIRLQGKEKLDKFDLNYKMEVELDGKAWIIKLSGHVYKFTPK